VREVRLASILCVGAVLFSACGAAKSPSAVNPAVIVLPDARGVRWADIYDGQVSYQVQESYPAPKVIAELRQRLRELGWHPRTVDILNPSGSSATAGKWGHVVIEGRTVAAWSEQWENAAGDVVWYGLRYMGKAKDDLQGPLDIIVSFFRASTVKALKSSLPPEAPSR
jgi:hypothetical protein